MEKIIVFGASGGTGRMVIEQALLAGHQVTAVVRNPAAFSLRHPNLDIVEGDVLQLPTLSGKLEGHDIVISCLGIPKIQQTTLYSQGMRNIVACMRQSGVNRIICISSGALEVPAKSSWIMTFLLKNVLQRIYKPVYADMTLMEGILSESGLDWTVVRAPKLTDGKQTQKYKVITNEPLRSIPQISRADLAHYMLSHLKDRNTFRSRVDIAY
jgi:putative NADH-flavin reductase